MGLSDLLPEVDPLIQCALTFDVVNHLLCSICEWKLHYIELWHLYLFRFGVQVSDMFKVYITTKMKRLMRHVHNHLFHLRFIRRGSSEENEIAHKQFKIMYNVTKKQPDSIATQLLTSRVRHPLPPPPFLDNS